MDIWDHDGKPYEVNSYYNRPDDAWQYELVGLAGTPGTGPYLIVRIPDATPNDGLFSPRPASDVVFRTGGKIAFTCRRTSGWRHEAVGTGRAA
ncbi:hypothetical protein AB0I95_29845 [Micromonospora sp. NPDC049751]|uniref:hypothetical protein n=1 Tax=unclassified Micromonospora TaxID=2617518 RepID=UPI0033E74072